MDRNTGIWLGFSAIFAIWSALSGGMLLPVALLIAAAACTAHVPTRNRVQDWLGGIFGYGSVRAFLLILGGAVMIQFLPIELALFAAADILTYVEIIAALSLMAANVKFQTLATAGARRFTLVRDRIVRRANRAFRAVRKSPDRPKIIDDPDSWRWPYALA